VQSSGKPLGEGLSADLVESLLAFVGYGNPDGGFWFVGMEEAGALTPGELETRAREFKPIDDLARVHDLHGYWMDRTRLIPTWSAMSRIVLRLSGRADWRDREAVRDYQVNRLGRLGGETFLTELLPLPSSSTAAWPYTALFPTRRAYADRVLPHRLLALRRLFEEHRPAYVFCYGKSYWRYYEEAFTARDLEELETERVRLGLVGRTCVVLTHFFSRYFMTDERVESIATRINALGSGH
jgi:hypothetical protein